MKTSLALQQIRPSYIREILSESKKPGMISLAGGLPATEMLPVNLFEDALASIGDAPELYQYGETKGYLPLLNYINENIAHENHDTLICTGSQQALDLVARAYLNPGDNVVVEAPSYLGALQVFGLAQANIQAVAQQSDGPNIEELEKLFSTRDIVFFYGVPDFHNPTGVCWSLEKRKQVAKLCLQYDVFFIEDSPYRELNFSNQSLPYVSSLCAEKSIVLRSFSKSVAPGIRLGCACAPQQFIAPLIKVKQAADLHTSLPMQAALLYLLRNKNYHDYLIKLCAEYKTKYEHFAVLAQSLTALGCHFNTVRGGMFAWLHIPNIDVMAFTRALLAQNVSVVPSPVFYSSDAIEKAIRINFTYCSKQDMTRAIKVIEQTLKQF